jgi:hypothetical protein
MLAYKPEKEDTKKAEIRNASAQAVEAFIKWMYLGTIEDVAVLEELYMLSEKYVVEGLKVSTRTFKYL